MLGRDRPKPQHRLPLRNLAGRHTHTQLKGAPIVLHLTDKRFRPVLGLGAVLLGCDGQILEPVHKVSDGNLLRAANGAIITGDTIPERVALQHLGSSSFSASFLSSLYRVMGYRESNHVLRITNSDSRIPEKKFPGSYLGARTMTMMRPSFLAACSTTASSDVSSTTRRKSAAPRSAWASSRPLKMIVILTLSRLWRKRFM